MWRGTLKPINNVGENNNDTSCHENNSDASYYKNDTEAMLHSSVNEDMKIAL